MVLNEDKCPICQGDFKRYKNVPNYQTPKTVVKHHFIPPSIGGLETNGNIFFSCRSCRSYLTSFSLDGIINDLSNEEENKQDIILRIVELGYIQLIPIISKLRRKHFNTRT